MNFHIAVREEAGIKRMSSPLTVGLPFPHGVVNDLSRIRIVARGEAIPAQLSEACRWGDGSLGWVHARLLLDLNTGEEMYLTVSVEEEAQPEDVEPPVRWKTDGRESPDRDMAEHLKDGGSFAVRLVIVENRGAVHRSLAPDRVDIEEAGSIYASLFESGPLEDEHGRQIFRYERRVHLWKGMSGAHVEYTFLFVAGDPVVELSEVRLEIPGRGTLASLTTVCGDSETHFSLNGSSFTLRQECVYEHEPEVQADHAGQVHNLGTVDFSYYLQAGDQTQRREKHPGWFAFESADGDWAVGVTPFWEVGPKEVRSGEDGRLTVWLVPPGGNLRFGKTRAITHDLFFLAGAETIDRLADLMHPLVPFVEAGYVGRTKTLPYVSPPRLGLFPEYEDWFRGGFDRWCQKCVEYGILHYGDWRVGAGSYRTSPSYFGDHEYDTMHILLIQFVRTGQSDYFHQGALAARHYADMDINQVTGEPRFHGYLGSADRHVEVYGMDWGHVFVDGLVDHYLLTGDRRSLILRLA